MQKIKLVRYQVQAIKSALEHSYDQIENMVLDKYNEMMIEDLNATDFEEIMEDIQDWHIELIEKAQ